MSLVIKCKCDTCEKHEQIEAINLFCNKCLEEKDENEEEENEKIFEYTIRDMMKEVIDNAWVWRDEEGYEFKILEEKRLFMRGVHHGFNWALHFVAEYFDKMEYLEELREKYYTEKWEEK